MWEYRTKSHVESSPCIADGKVYIGAGADGMYCIALKPKSGNEPDVLWHLEGEKYPDCETSPIVHEGKAYFGLGLGGQAVVCVDAATGKELWRTKTPFPVFSSPCIADGKVFVGMGHGNMVLTAEDLRDQAIKKLREAGASPEAIAEARKMPLHGEVWALDLATGKVEWTYKTDRTIMGVIAAAGKRLYFGTQGGNFYCLSTDGKSLGTPFNARSQINASPAIGAQHVYFVSQEGQLYALDVRTLRPKWEMPIATAGGMFVSSPAVGRGHVYVGTDADGLVCVGRAVEQKKKIYVWAGALGGPGETGWTDGSPFPHNGKRGWRYPAKTGPDGAAMVAPAAAMGKAVYVGLQDATRKGLAKEEAMQSYIDVVDSLVGG